MKRRGSIVLLNYVDEQIYDITVIGGGPTGLFTTFYGGLRQCSVKVIESMPQLGGQLAALYPEKYIYDIAGFPKVRAQELVDSLREQILQFNPSLALEERALNVEKVSNNFKITTDRRTHFSKSIIITAGVGAFEPRRLVYERTDKFENGNLHYFVNDISKFNDKRL